MKPSGDPALQPAPTPEEGFALLVDCRESHCIRGFHALAAVALALPQLPAGARVTALTSGQSDELTAIHALRHDSGRDIRPWRPAAAMRRWYERLILSSRRPHDLFLAVADAMPSDAWSRHAIKGSRAVLIGLTGTPPQAARGHVSLMDGHDTRALAQAVIDRASGVPGSGRP